jgi:4-hydroxybenzoate polyprenyltransferase
MKRTLLVFHWMNVDTALGAVVTSLFIAKSMEILVPKVATFALFLAVLAIYNFDHLLDAKHIDGQAISRRHRFYQKKFNILSVFQLLLLIALLAVSWFIPTLIARAGIILAVLALIYFLLLFIVLPNRFVLKELLIATVFVSGLFLAPMAIVSLPAISTDIVLFSIQIFLLALANTFIFSWFDYEIDKKEGHTSIAQVLGKEKVYIFSLILLACLGVIIVLRLLLTDTWFDQFVIGCMGLVLLLILLFSNSVNKNEVFRIVGEAIFLIPIIALLW